MTKLSNTVTRRGHDPNQYPNIIITYVSSSKYYLIFHINYIEYMSIDIKENTENVLDNINLAS